MSFHDVSDPARSQQSGADLTDFASAQWIAGLLDPERTPSGYRKFYEADVERLRYILALQRDQFLPLKVIRERLDQIDGNGGVDTLSYALAGNRPDGISSHSELWRISSRSSVRSTLPACST